jgi:hypothetical protein
MAALERTDAGMRLRLAGEEVEVVASLAEGLAIRLTHASDASTVSRDDVVDRLAPTVSRGDPDVDAELRGMLRDELLTTRATRLRDLAALLRSGGDGSDGLDLVVDRDGAMRIVEALNDLRLALAATVGYDDLVREELVEGDQRADAVRLMDALAWLQGGLIDFIEAD